MMTQLKYPIKRIQVTHHLPQKKSIVEKISKEHQKTSNSYVEIKFATNNTVQTQLFTLISKTNMIILNLRVQSELNLKIYVDEKADLCKMKIEKNLI